MKDDELLNVLETISSDLKRIEIEFKKQREFNNSIEVLIKNLSEVQRENSVMPNNSVTTEVVDHSLAVSLKRQIDRIILKMQKDETFWHYYFSPTKTFFKTSIILAIAIGVGIVIGHYFLEKETIDNLNQYEHREDF